MKHFRGYSARCANYTFGMYINGLSDGYKEMKANIQPKTVKGRWGRDIKILAVPAQYVADMMGAAGWLVSENQDFKSFQMDDGAEIFIDYPDGIHLWKSS